MTKTMTTQVTFKIDKKLKDLAMKKAQSEGLPFGALLKLVTKAFVDGSLSIGLVREEFKPKVRKEIEKAIANAKAGKNISPGFSSAKDAVAYLRSNV
jgi:hypothetical protein